jgi:ribulose-bisphosphate carboxylase large chain
VIGIRYIDYVNLNHKPASTDVVCKFYIDPIGMDLKEAAGAVAAESSIGTWTELTAEHKYVEALAATVFEIRGGTAKISYPSDLFEPGNMPNILSSVAGNVFGLKGLRNLKLLDVQLPEKIVKSFKGPKYGIDGVRKILKVKDRCLIGTIIKPKLGLRTADHAKVAYEAWSGGCDIVKDDENLSSQSFNRFQARVAKTLKMCEKAEKETGEVKAYMPNVTAELEEMIRRANFVEDNGGTYAMVDVLTVGWSALQTLRNENLDIALHGHRAMHAALTKNPSHGISMRVLAKLLRIVGIDQLHVGTAVGKMSETREEVLANVDALKSSMHGLRRVMPVASGGLHPALIPKLIGLFGNDVVIQMGGGVHGHPNGTMAGAKAARQAVDAITKGEGLDMYARRHKELAVALKRWG